MCPAGMIRVCPLASMRRRGYTSAAVRDFIDRVGVSKADSMWMSACS